MTANLLHFLPYLVIACLIALAVTNRKHRP